MNRVVFALGMGLFTLLTLFTPMAKAESPTPTLAKAKAFEVRVTWWARREGEPLRPYTRFDFHVRKPGKLAVEKYMLFQGGENDGKPDTRYPGRTFSDGKTQYDYLSAANQYLKLKPAPPGQEINSILLFHFDFEPLLAPAPYIGYTAEGEETLDGKHMRIYSCQQQITGYRNKLYVDKRSGLPARLVALSSRNGVAVEQNRFDYSDWKLDAKLDDALFTWTPPADATPYQLLKRDSMLQVGAVAPDFQVEDRNGKPVKLSDFKGKVIVLDFWATWCGPCLESMPHTAKVARKYAGKEVVVLAVCMHDERDRFTAWVDKHPEFSHLHFALDPQQGGQEVANKIYGVGSIPAQFVIDRDGKIVATFVGYGGPDPSLENAIKEAGKF